MMTQAERLVFLIQYLQSEQPKYRNIPIPEDISQQKSVLRTLMNIRPPKAISSDVRKVQNAYLREEIKQMLSEAGIDRKTRRRVFEKLDKSLAEQVKDRSLRNSRRELERQEERDRKIEQMKESKSN